MDSLFSLVSNALIAPELHGNFRLSHANMLLDALG